MATPIDTVAQNQANLAKAAVGGGYTNLAPVTSITLPNGKSYGYNAATDSPILNQPVATPFAAIPVTPVATTLPSPGAVGATPASPAPLTVSPTTTSSAATNVATIPGGPISQPVSSVSPAQTTPDDNSLLQQVLNGLSSGGNATSAGSGGGVGADDTSLPSPTTADVEALQPQAVSTSSSGPNIGLIIGIVLVLALGVYLWYRHKKGKASE
jgi:hypothetical protein